MVIADAVCPECGQELEVEIPDGENPLELTVDCDSCGETEMDIIAFDAERKMLTLAVVWEEEIDDEDEGDE